MGKNLFIGVDIGGTKCSVVRGDEGFNILEKEKINTSSFQETMDNLMNMVAKMMTPDVRAIGISCGGPLDSKAGVIMSPPNLPGWDNVPIVQMLVERFGIPTFLRNDANACAIAEWKHGAGQGCRNVVFLTFGTGLGAGVILDGRLYSGTCDMAGEIGHVRLRDGGHVGYGKEGSYEGYCSGSGIAQYGLGTAKELAVKAFQGDPQALEVFRKVGRDLGRGVSLIIDLLNPEVVIIGSIYARAEEFIAPSMEEVIRQEAIERSRKVVRVVASQLGDTIGDVAALGVAMLGLEA